MEFKEIDQPSRSHWDELEAKLLTLEDKKALLVTPQEGQTLEQLRANIIASFKDRVTKISTKIEDNGVAVWVRQFPVIAGTFAVPPAGQQRVVPEPAPAPVQPKLLTAPRGTYAKPPQKAK